MSSNNTSNAIVRICSEDVLPDGTVFIPSGFSSGSQVYVTAYITQTNYNFPQAQTFAFDIGAGTETVTIPAGYYTQAQLVNVLSTMLAALHVGFTAQVVQYTHLIQLSYTAPWTILATLSSQRLMDVIGFSQTATYTGLSTYTSQTVGTGSYKGPVMILKIEGLNRNYCGDYATRNDGMVTVPIPYADFGSTNIYDPSVPIYFDLQHGQFITRLNVKFLDDYGETINFNGGIWNIVLNFEGSLYGHI